MKKLIINADDAGLSDAVNEAIRQCYLAGAITGVSIMPCGKKFPEAVHILHDLGKTEVGVHLTFTGLFSPCVQSPSQGKDKFSDKTVFSRDYMELISLYASKKINTDEIYGEFADQIKVARENDLKITHLDSHEHIHMFSDIFRVVVALAEINDIPYIRIPLERMSVIWKQFKVRDLARFMGLKLFSSRRKKTKLSRGIKLNDTFCGHFHSGRMNDVIMCHMVKKLNDGVTELALHPAVESEEFLKEFPWYKNSHIELDALINGKWRSLVEEKGIKLVTHKEAVG